MRLPTKQELIAVEKERKEDFCQRSGLDLTSPATALASLMKIDPESPSVGEAVEEIKKLEAILEQDCPRFMVTQLLMLQIGPTGWSSLLTDLCGLMLQVGYNIGQSEALDILGKLPDDREENK